MSLPTGSNKLQTWPKKTHGACPLALIPCEALRHIQENRWLEIEAVSDLKLQSSPGGLPDLVSPARAQAWKHLLIPGAQPAPGSPPGFSSCSSPLIQQCEFPTLPGMAVYGMWLASDCPFSHLAICELQLKYWRMLFHPSRELITYFLTGVPEVIYSHRPWYLLFVGCPLSTGHLASMISTRSATLLPTLIGEEAELPCSGIS